MSKHLIIGDSHAHPDFSNERFNWLGKLIHDIRPDVIINIGDMYDFPSLCAHASAKEIEGGRYQRDVEAGKDANERLMYEIKKGKKKIPRRVYCLGNHDIRPVRYVEDYPSLEGKLSQADLGLEDFGWEVYPFLESVRIDGIAYSHYFTSGVLNRPISGIHTAYVAAVKGHESRTFGHIHTGPDWKIDATTGRTIMGLNVGCYVDYPADYAGVANSLWGRGIAVCHDVHDGLYDLDWISLDRIRRAYG